MPAPHGGPSLPNELLKQLGIGPSANGTGGKFKKGFQTRSQGRKDQRKQARQDKKGHHAPRNQTTSRAPNGSARGGRVSQGSKPPARIKSSSAPQRDSARERVTPKVARPTKAREEEEEIANPFSSDDSLDEDDFDDFGLGGEEDYDPDDDEDEDEAEADGPSHARVSKADQEKMAKDDAEIARLEKKLGLKGKKALPKSFQEDGLGDLLGELDGDSGSEGDHDKRKRKAIDDEWLAQKRRKTAAASRHAPAVEEEEEEIMNPFSSDDELDEDDMLMDSGDLDDIAGDSDGDLDDDEEGDEDDDGDERREQPRRRENPYVAPVTASATKYVPPSRREPAGSDAEASKLVQRKAQGLVNRLTEANIVAILGDIEKLYQESPRQYATDAIVNTIMAQLTDRSSLQGTMLILYAAFATAVYKVIGSDFGAHLVQRTVDEFKAHYSQASSQAGEHHAIAKQPSNLLVFMTQLYMFRMIGSNLVFDYVRMLLGELSELNAELLLQVLRNSGQRLRQEDALALKDIIGLIRPAVERAGGKDAISVRTQFMIETMYDLKNNKTKSRTDPSHAQNLDHATRLNKALGTLNTRRLKATEPLRVTLEDLELSDKRGKWWLVGASWAGTDARKDAVPAPKSAARDAPVEDVQRDSDGDEDYFPGIPNMQKLNELAKAEGMNTDARYSIFRSLLVSADSQEAYLRLQRLRLNKIERREIPSVIIQCSGSEVKYNPFYTEVAKRVCSDHKAQWGFQDVLWKLFKRVGETLFDQDDGEDDAGDDDDLGMERLTNVGTMYGTLIANGTLGIRVLKCLNMAMLRPKTQATVQAIIIGLLQERVKLGKAKKKDVRGVFIKEAFLAVDSPEFARGLRYFLKKVVRKAKEVKTSKKSLPEALALAEEALAEVETRE